MIATEAFSCGVGWQRRVEDGGEMMKMVVLTLNVATYGLCPGAVGWEHTDIQPCMLENECFNHDCRYA